MKKTTTIHTSKVIPYCRPGYGRKYPNAAAPGYRLRRYLDLALAAAISLASVSTLLCMLTMW